MERRCKSPDWKPGMFAGWVRTDRRGLQSLLPARAGHERGERHQRPGLLDAGNPDDRAGRAPPTTQCSRAGSWASPSPTPTPHTRPHRRRPADSDQRDRSATNSIAWYQVNVPTNAIAATNILLFATAPVNVWYSANHPPTTNNPGDAVLIATQQHRSRLQPC